MRLREHSHFIIAHRNLISTLCYYRRSSLEYSGEQRSFYDVNDNSFLPFSFFFFFSVRIVPLAERVKFISVPFLFLSIGLKYNYNEQRR